MGRIIPYIMEKMFDTTNQIIYVSTPCHLIEDTDMVLACLRHCWFGTTDIHNEAATISVSSATRSMGLWPEAWQPMAWQSSWSIDGFRLTDKHHKHLVIILRRPTGYWKKNDKQKKCVGLLIGCWLYLRLRVRLYSNGSIGHAVHLRTSNPTDFRFLRVQHVHPLSTPCHQIKEFTAVSKLTFGEVPWLLECNE